MHTKERLSYGWAAHLLTTSMGFVALIWFLIRVIPKPSRASYPCQRAAFPLASAFVLWLCSLSGFFSLVAIRRFVRRYTWLPASAITFALVVAGAWFYHANQAQAAGRAALWNYIPQHRNQPLGVARGIFPGRVIWVRDSKAAHWSGDLNSLTDQWWMDVNNDQTRIDAMMSTTLQQLPGSKTDEEAWQKIFTYHNARVRGAQHRGYQNDETIAVKINLNNSTATGIQNYVNASPQVTLAIVRQLVLHAHVPPSKIIVYDARRNIYPQLLTKIWIDFKDVRFVQSSDPQDGQPVNPGYGNYHGLEKADWVEGIEYSANSYRNARMIPRQIKGATYLINLALLKAHSYPWAAAEGGDEGQTAVTLTGKNHFGSILGTSELHGAINTNRDGTAHAYSPSVDLASSPDLGDKTILYMLDALYCGRRHQSYPVHFPNPPFNNRVEPYANQEWPSSLLASLDGVAIDSVGIDILYSQSQNNLDKENHPRILLRENADDYLMEEADPEHAPSGIVYKQRGKAIESQGVFEHWDSDVTRQYSRNKDPKYGKGIELIFLAK